jgi:hypothetical protein
VSTNTKSIAALGFRVHSGWAVMVAVAGTGRGPVVVERRRIEMVESDTMKAKQPYHAAAEGNFKDAAELIAGSMSSAARLAERAIRDAIAALRTHGYEVGGCSVLAASGRLLPELRAILASHAMIHAAEGEMFRRALREGGAKCGLKVMEQSERELLNDAGAVTGLTASALERRATEMGKSVGRPWRQDEKHAALAAWMLLF